MYIEKSQIHGKREFILEDDCVRIDRKTRLGDSYSLTFDYSSLSKNPSEQYPINHYFVILLVFGFIGLFFLINLALNDGIYTTKMFIIFGGTVGMFLLGYFKEVRKLVYVFQNHQGIMLFDVSKSSDEFEGFIDELKGKIAQSKGKV